MNATIKQKLNILTNFNESFDNLMDQKIDGFSLKDVLNDLGTAESPMLKELISEMLANGVNLFHISDKNFVHNHHYRDYITDIIYEKNKPWQENNKKNGIHGTDNYGSNKPDTEFKSICVTKENNYYYIQLNTKLGEIDKIPGRTINDKIYGPNSRHALCAIVFNSKGNEALYGVYVSAEEFGNTIWEHIKEQQSNPKSGRDSMTITIGMLIKCKSFKIFNINPKYNIVYDISSEDNLKCYQLVSEFLGDKEFSVKSKVSNFNNNDMLVNTYSNEGASIFDISNFTIADLSFSKIYENPSLLKKDLVCCHYFENEIIFISRIKNEDWVPLFERQKSFYEEYNEEYKNLILNGIDKKEAKNMLKKDNFQQDIIRADKFRIKSKDIKFVSHYINKDKIDKFKIKKSKNIYFNDVFDLINV